MKHAVFGVAALVSLVFVIRIHGIVPSEEPLLTVTALDVGQGDAIHLRTSDGIDVLIDGGRDMSVLEGLGRSLPFFDRQIEYLVLTHPDADHVTGLAHVMQRYDVGTVLTTGVSSGSAVYEAFEREIDSSGASFEIVREGDSVRLSEDVVLNVLFPTDAYIRTDPERNDTTIVLRADVGEARFLFGGDLERDGEEALLAAHGSQAEEALHADVWLVGHHGSATSGSPAYLNAISPSVGLISAGEDNAYGHPHERTLGMLSSRGVKTFRTDEGGDIVCKTNGKRPACSYRRKAWFGHAKH